MQVAQDQVMDDFSSSSDLDSSDNEDEQLNPSHTYRTKRQKTSPATSRSSVEEDVTPDSTDKPCPMYLDGDGRIQLRNWFLNHEAIQPIRNKMEEFLKVVEGESIHFYASERSANARDDTIAVQMSDTVIENATESLSTLDRDATPQSFTSGFDTLLDNIWSKFVSAEVEVSDDLMAFLVKPSGSLSAPLSIRWHYPSFTSSTPFFQSIADKTNPCVRMIFKKLGLCSGDEIFQSELYHRREKRIRDESMPYNIRSPDILAAHSTFSQELATISKARVVVLLGTTNYTQLRQFAGGKTIKIKLWNHKTFRQTTDMWAILDETDSISRVVFIAQHPESTFHGGASGAQTLDLVMNLSSALSFYPMPVNTSYFAWRQRMTHRLGVDKDGTELPVAQKNTLSQTLTLLRYEILTGIIVDRSKIGSNLEAWISKNSFTPEMNNLSLVRQIHNNMVGKSVAKQAARGFPNLVTARATVAALGFPNLIAGRANIAAQGHPNLAAGRATMAAQGFPGQLAGLATAHAMAAAVWESRLSTMTRSSQIHEPAVMLRKCNKCEEVSEDQNPRWVELNLERAGGFAVHYVAFTSKTQSTMLCQVCRDNTTKGLLDVKDFRVYHPVDQTVKARADYLLPRDWTGGKIFSNGLQLPFQPPGDTRKALGFIKKKRSKKQGTKAVAGV